MTSENIEKGGILSTNEYDRLVDLFDQWYVENIFDLDAEPIGSRSYKLKRIAFMVGIDYGKRIALSRL